MIFMNDYKKMMKLSSCIVGLCASIVGFSVNGLNIEDGLIADDVDCSSNIEYISVYNGMIGKGMDADKAKICSKMYLKCKDLFKNADIAKAYIEYLVNYELPPKVAMDKAFRSAKEVMTDIDKYNEIYKCCVGEGKISDEKCCQISLIGKECLKAGNSLEYSYAYASDIVNGGSKREAEVYARIYEKVVKSSMSNKDFAKAYAYYIAHMRVTEGQANNMLRHYRTCLIQGLDKEYSLAYAYDIAMGYAHEIAQKRAELYEKSVKEMKESSANIYSRLIIIYGIEEKLAKRFIDVYEECMNKGYREDYAYVFAFDVINFGRSGACDRIKKYNHCIKNWKSAAYSCAYSYLKNHSTCDIRKVASEYEKYINFNKIDIYDPFLLSFIGDGKLSTAEISNIIKIYGENMKLGKGRDYARAIAMNTVVREFPEKYVKDYTKVYLEELKGHSDIYANVYAYYLAVKRYDEERARNMAEHHEKYIGNMTHDKDMICKMVYNAYLDNKEVNAIDEIHKSELKYYEENKLFDENYRRILAEKKSLTEKYRKFVFNGKGKKYGNLCISLIIQGIPKRIAEKMTFSYLKCIKEKKSYYYAKTYTDCMFFLDGNEEASRRKAEVYDECITKKNRDHAYANAYAHYCGCMGLTEEVSNKLAEVYKQCRIDMHSHYYSDKYAKSIVMDGLTDEESKRIAENCERFGEYVGLNEISYEMIDEKEENKRLQLFFKCCSEKEKTKGLFRNENIEINYNLVCSDLMRKGIPEERACAMSKMFMDLLERGAEVEYAYAFAYYKVIDGLLSDKLVDTRAKLYSFLVKSSKKGRKYADFCSYCIAIERLSGDELQSVMRLYETKIRCGQREAYAEAYAYYKIVENASEEEASLKAEKYDELMRHGNNREYCRAYLNYFNLEVPDKDKLIEMYAESFSQNIDPLHREFYAKMRIKGESAMEIKFKNMLEIDDSVPNFEDIDLESFKENQKREIYEEAISKGKSTKYAEIYATCIIKGMTKRDADLQARLYQNAISSDSDDESNDQDEKVYEIEKKVDAKKTKVEPGRNVLETDEDEYWILKANEEIDSMKRSFIKEGLNIRYINLYCKVYYQFRMMKKSVSFSRKCAEGVAYCGKSIVEASKEARMEEERVMVVINGGEQPANKKIKLF